MISEIFFKTWPLRKKSKIMNIIIGKFITGICRLYYHTIYRFKRFIWRMKYKKYGAPF